MTKFLSKAWLAEDEVVFDKVIAVVDGDKLNVGAPYVEGAEVKATVLKNGKAKKITVFTYKPKKGYKRKLVTGSPTQRSESMPLM